MTLHVTTPPKCAAVGNIYVTPLITLRDCVQQSLVLRRSVRFSTILRHADMILDSDNSVYVLPQKALL